MSGPMTREAASALENAAHEASRRGDRRVGTDHLLLGLLHNPMVADSLGTDLEAARAAADRLDRAALAAIGLDLTTAPPSAIRRRPGSASPTSGLRAAISRAVGLAAAERLRKAEPRHLLEALFECQRPDPAAELLDALDLGPQVRTRAPR